METEKRSQEEPLHFRYDEFCDLLGGADWDRALPCWRLSGLTPKRDRALASLSSRFSSPPQFLFSSPSKAHPLEVFWLKWGLFTRLCREVEAFHRGRRKPLLNIHPAGLSVRVSDSTVDFAPARWLFSLKIDEPTTASPVLDEDMPPEFRARFFSPAPDLEDVYQAPVLRETGPGRREEAAALIFSLEKIPQSKEEKVRGIVELNLISENIRPSDYSERDVFSVTIDLPDANASVRVWAGHAAPLERGLLVKGTTEPLSRSVWESLGKNRQKVFSHSKVILYKTRHVPCDLYGLGILLLRTLLVHDRQDLAAVDQTATRILNWLSPMARGIGPEENGIIAKRFRLRLKEEGDLFEKRSLLYASEERQRGAESVPDDLWSDALLLALRLATSIPGFSFCKDHGDYDIENPQASMEKVTPRVEALGRRIKAELFEPGRRNREVLEACDLVLSEGFSVRDGRHV